MIPSPATSMPETPDGIADPARVQQRSSEGLGRWQGSVLSSLAIGLVIGVLTWPSSTASLTVRGGLDPSWHTTLAMAAHDGMPFGTHIVFTFGPLGFLVDQGLRYQWTTIASIIFNLAMSTAVLGVLVWSLRRTVPLIVAVVVTYAVAAATFRAGNPIEVGLALVLFACVALLNRNGDPTPRWAWVVLGGAFSVLSMVKVSLGIGIAAALIVTVACLPGDRFRAIGGIAIGAIPAFCLGWFGTGNGFVNVVPFAQNSAAIIGGYASAMSSEVSSRFFAYGLAAIVLVLLAIFSLVRVNELPRRSAIGVLLVTLIIVWLLLKEGFVRHDTHDLVFFAAAPVVLAALAPKRWSWILVPGILALAGVFLIAANGVLWPIPRPDLASRNLVAEVAAVVSPSRAAAIIDKSRQSLRRTYALPNRMVAMMQGHTVDVSPWDQTVAWAYPRIRFDPLPVIQDYSAYTLSLDQLDANYLRSPGAPRFILRQPGLAVDGRFPAFEPPTTQFEIECRYRQVAGNLAWQLLERGADRCGPLRPLGVATSGFDHWVAVPTAPTGNALVARIQLSQGWSSKLENVIFKPPSVYVMFNRDERFSRAFRFVAATAPDLHLLRTASTLGYFRVFVPAPITSLRFSIQGGYPTPTGVRIAFYQVRVSAVAGGNGEVLPELHTNMLVPANGANLSGAVPIDAETTDDTSVTSVSFYLTDPSRSDILIGTGTKTLIGWIGSWNTTKVANGTYALHSVAYDVAGQSSRSPDVTVTVGNKGSHRVRTMLAPDG